MQNTMQAVSTIPADARSVAWAAVSAGACAAAALSLILLALGLGLGLATVSPWISSDAAVERAGSLGGASLAWLIMTQIAAAGLGGYLAGRLRARSVTASAAHSNEVYFRDTAHGFLTWAVATLLVAVLAGVVVGKTLTAGASAAAEVGGHSASLTNYLVDSLFRSEQPNSNVADAARRVEVARIFLNGIRSNQLPEQDRQYLAQLVAAYTGLTTEQAERRVAALSDYARQAAEKARQAAAYASLWMFAALLSAAFVASVCAVLGGRQRDSVA